MYEERLERAERRRILGNELFAEGRYKEALAKYAGVSDIHTHTHTHTHRCSDVYIHTRVHALRDATKRHWRSTQE